MRVSALTEIVNLEGADTPAFLALWNQVLRGLSYVDRSTAQRAWDARTVEEEDEK